METEKDFLLKSSVQRVKRENNLSVLQRLTGNEGGQKAHSSEDVECDGHLLRFDQNKKLFRDLQKIGDNREKRKLIQKHWESLRIQHQENLVSLGNKDFSQRFRQADYNISAFLVDLKSFQAKEDCLKDQIKSDLDLKRSLDQIKSFVKQIEESPFQQLWKEFTVDSVLMPNPR